MIPPETPASWTWIPWEGGGEWWNRTRYLGSRPFSAADDLPQYWELENPEPYNSIGLILENGRRWIVRADGFVTRKTTAEEVEPMIGKKTIGLLWDPAARTISLFADDSFLGVLWDNAPPLFLPMINPWPQGGQPGGRRTQAGFTGLVKLCLDRVADTIGGGEIRDLPLPTLFLGKLGRIQRGGRNLACHTKHHRYGREAIRDRPDRKRARLDEQ